VSLSVLGRGERGSELGWGGKESEMKTQKGFAMAGEGRGDGGWLSHEGGESKF